MRRTGLTGVSVVVMVINLRTGITTLKWSSTAGGSYGREIPAVHLPTAWISRDETGGTAARTPPRARTGGPRRHIHGFRSVMEA
ncbi:hypothetical protein GCM10010363_61530 [Streptomyces omiyaensis]|nr:hypothetical protein GCM10010363_61530 [Streptomyces omiyaensis]